MSDIIGWGIFLLLAVIAVVTAASMLVTMSMYRAGLALMASFVALAGIFFLLDADLPAAIQIMMNVGGMLIMVLFMVMLMMDPGGEMMWGMKRSMHMRGIGAFAMAMPRGKPAMVADQSMAPPPSHPVEQHDQVYTCPMHSEVRQDHPGTCPKCGMTLVAATAATPSHVEMDMTAVATGDPPMSGMAANDTSDMAHGDMSSMTASGDTHIMQMDGMASMNGMDAQQDHQMMVDMAMSTAQLPWALVLGVATAIALSALVILTPWSLAGTAPTQDASAVVGKLLLGRYMVGFEGAAFLIVAGIAGAVILGRRETEMTSTPAAVLPPADLGQTMYTCPMHPEIHQDHSGTCPKCGMDLVPAPKGQTDANNPHADMPMPPTPPAATVPEPHHHGGAS